MVRTSRTFFYEAELYRLRGNVLMKSGAGLPQAVDTCFQQALKLARRYATGSLELRAAVSLAHFWRDQGKHREARDLLVEVYGRFTEGFGTADLVEANAILQQTERNSKRPVAPR